MWHDWDVDDIFVICKSILKWHVQYAPTSAFMRSLFMLLPPFLLSIHSVFDAFYIKVFINLWCHLFFWCIPDTCAAFCETTNSVHVQTGSILFCYIYVTLYLTTIHLFLCVFFLLSSYTRSPKDSQKEIPVPSRPCWDGPKTLPAAIRAWRWQILIRVGEMAWHSTLLFIATGGFDW